MRVRARARAVALVAAASALGTVTAGTATAGATTGHHTPDPVARVVTEGLEGPFGVQAVGRRGLLVAESGSGEVTAVSRWGHQRVVISGAPGVAGVAGSRHHVFAVTGGPNETGETPPGTYGPSQVIRSDYRGRHARVIADLGAYELAHNPDGQVQFVDGAPVDALSNPFAMTMTRWGLLVADGGANDVLRVDPRTGRVSTFFVPHTVTDVAACLEPGAQSNPGTVGCDPVPTGVAVSGRSVYVSTLGAEVPGAGRVYKLDARTGRVQHVWKGLTSPTGIAVTPRGTVYLSEVLFNAPEGEPPADFDPSSIGRLTRIQHGRMTHAAVTMPTGLDYDHGRLYASTWSVAGLFLGIPNAGKVVEVNQRAFR